MQKLFLRIFLKPRHSFLSVELRKFHKKHLQKQTKMQTNLIEKFHDLKFLLIFFSKAK